MKTTSSHSNSVPVETGKNPVDNNRLILTKKTEYEVNILNSIY